MPIFGQAFWPGVQGFISCTYTVSHGTGASAATLEIPEQDVRGILSYGTLEINDGVGVVRIRRARLADIAFNSSPTGGRTIVLTIVDRRWMWRYGSIDGNWNQIDPYPDIESFPPGDFVISGGPYAPGTYRVAANLMKDCLVAMNEITDPLISPAPIVATPVQWNAENPAQALAEVCNAVGYRVCYQPNADRVLCAPAGQGALLLDSLPIIANHPVLALPTRPATIQLIGGDTLYHDYLALEPVGLERDGTIKRLDALSYKPKNGWASCDPNTMGLVQATAELTQLEAIELAKRYVWRTFRVKRVDVATGAAPGPNVGGFGLIDDRKQIVLGSQIFFNLKRIDGQPDNEPAYIVGSVYIPPIPGAVTSGMVNLAKGAFGNTIKGSGVRLPFKPQVDTARGLVTFDRQLYQNLSLPPSTAVNIGPPDIAIYTSFSIRSLVGWIPQRFVWGGTLPGQVDLGCPPETIRRPDLVKIVRAIRNSKDLSLASVGNNLDDLIPPANYYLEAANQKYEIGAATDRTYAGIVPIDPDGAIQQVTWSVGGGQPATTRVSRNCEHAQYLPSYPERRRNEDTRRFLGRAEVDSLSKSAPPSVSPSAKWYMGEG